MIVICMKNKIKRGETKMGKKKKTSRFYIEYGKSKKCSDCCKGKCYRIDTASDFMKKLFYCIKCSLTSDKKGFVHK